jgi:hypothetical protein
MVPTHLEVVEVDLPLRFMGCGVNGPVLQRGPICAKTLNKDRSARLGMSERESLRVLHCATSNIQSCMQYLFVTRNLLKKCE